MDASAASLPPIATMKEIVQDLPPKRIKYLQFGVASPEEIAKQGVLEVNGRDLYTLENHSPAPNGALDTKMVGGSLVL